MTSADAADVERRRKRRRRLPRSIADALRESDLAMRQRRSQPFENGHGFVDVAGSRPAAAHVDPRVGQRADDGDALGVSASGSTPELVKHDDGAPRGLARQFAARRRSAGLTASSAPRR